MCAVHSKGGKCRQAEQLIDMITDQLNNKLKQKLNLLNLISKKFSNSVVYRLLGIVFLESFVLKSIYFQLYSSLTKTHF